MGKAGRVVRVSRLLLLIIGIAGCAATANDEYVPTAHERVLYQAPIAGIGVEGKEVKITHFLVSAGYIGDKHMHPGPTFVYVLKGELTVKHADETKTLKMGEVYAMEAGQVVTGMNLAPSDELEILVFQIEGVGEPAMIIVE